MAAAQFDSMAPDTPVPLSATRRWPSRDVPDLSELQVVDLSSLWAGPLSARVLSDAGAPVTKVESAARPDGARGTPDFYRHLHPDEQSNVVVDLSSARGRAQLHELVEAADVVIEASRPRALEQLGSGPEQVRPKSGRVWLSITGYGRRGPGANWIAFGDDAAVAGGLTAKNDTGEPVFCADAVADPVTGLFGAAAVLRSLAAGGGHLIDLALAGAAAAVARAGTSESIEPLAPMWPS
jgi:crotonobetainyl-CoA:carnitine CoA-transferase CaiB-like acyl-CoA transferase